MWFFLFAACSDPPVAVSVPVAQAESVVPAAFKNGEGKLVCPVMGDVVASPEEAAGHFDHGGLRYYFCCSSCEVAMRADPSRYANGAFLATLGKDGQPAETCE